MVDFVLQVMKAMNFGPNFMSYIKTQHTGITTQFILGEVLLRELQVLISLRQGDPTAMPLS